jgi:membrane protein implicated in regulation of membrane protease activity
MEPLPPLLPKPAGLEILEALGEQWMKIQDLDFAGPGTGPASASPGGGPAGRSKKAARQVPPLRSLAAIPALLLLIWVVADFQGYPLEQQNDLFDVLQKIVTISATLLGAIWAYYAFFRERLKEPRLNVGHQIHRLDLPDGRRLLKVYATIANVGQVRVELPVWRLRADQILPLTATPQKDLDRKAFTDTSGHSHWNCLAEGQFSRDDKSFGMALEPGETDRAAANLVIPAGIEVVQVYSHFSRDEDSQGREGWPSRTLVDFRKNDPPKEDADA